MAAQSGSPSVPQLLHGVSGGCSNAGPPYQERPEDTPEDGGQLSPVTVTMIHPFVVIKHAVFVEIVHA